MIIFISNVQSKLIKRVSSFTGPMDYQKNIVLLDEMANRYVNSSVVMYGLVANWIPIYKYFIDFKNVFGGNITLNEGKNMCNL